VDQVELLETNPTYATVRYPDGRQSTVSVRDLAPCSTPIDKSIVSDSIVEEENISEIYGTMNNSNVQVSSDISHPESNIADSNIVKTISNNLPSPQSPVCPNVKSVRQSTRVCKAPVRYGFDD
jgi:hypothetical protein